LKKVAQNNIAKKLKKSPPNSAPRKSRIKAAEKVTLRIVGMGGSADGLEAFEQFFSNMPSDTGMAFTLVSHLDPTRKGIMPELLQRHTKMKVGQIEDGMQVRPNCIALLQKVFILLRAHTGNDFSCYKNNTIHRRIERRMNVHQFDSLARYVRFLQENPQEVDLLYKELLIGVTNFFRDPGLFEFLKEKAIPRLLQSRQQGGPLRIWTPACSTGEETYSLAIVLKEILDEMNLKVVTPIQFFATDIDKEAIDKARQGTFSAGIASDVSPQRLKRYFIHEGDGYRIKKDIRDTIIFAPQNILVDPPFTKLDILCCRNLLIYVNAPTQKKLLPLLHYALSPGGLLILGSAESVGEFGHLFSTLEKKWKIFQAAEPSERPLIEMPAFQLPRERAASTSRADKTKEPVMDVSYAAQRVLLDPYRTADNVIEGVVITFADITALKQLEDSLKRQKTKLDVARQYAESIIATIREPLVVLDDRLRIVSASPSFYETFQVTPAQTEGQFLYEICQRQWDIPALRQLLEDILPKNTEFEDFRVEHDFARIGHKVLLLNARRVAQKDQQTHLILLAMEDITVMPQTGKHPGVKS
jgi:chemotaxis methyl-accepting protein methylase